jgi:NAD(P)H dehydrogenase (quinone)
VEHGRAEHEGLEHASYELAGDSATMAEYVAAAVRLRGVELRPESGAPAAAQLPPHLPEGSESAQDMRTMFEEYDRHGLQGNPTVLTHLLGRPPHTFEAAVARMLANGASVGLSSP